MSNRYSIRREEQRRRRKRNNIIAGLIFAGAFIAALIIIINIAMGGGKKNDSDGEKKVASEGSDQTAGGKEGGESGESKETAAPNSKEGIIKEAELLAAQYDYDAAIEKLEGMEGAESDADISDMITDYKAKKSSLVATSPQEVTHVFFHSLIVDPKAGFSLTGSNGWDRLTPGFCQWMTTVHEFDEMMKQMYDKGYVLVSIYDMVDIEKDENGVEHISGKDIYLPEGKIPFVLSLDDLSYYHSYDGRGCATKMIIGEDGKPTCEYIDENGKTQVGSYDCVPRLDDFVEEHPDFSYKGAKGTIALTGYNGILGYRTDFCYRDHEDLLDDQAAWLDANPDFDWDKECAEAKKVADAIKEDGWTFANHTWGHIRIGDSELDRIQTDTTNWKNTVEPLVGETDIIIFAHGQDLASWDEEYSETEKFRYLKDQGYSIFCNVDGSTRYFVQIDDEYLRMGRRNLDGLRLWQAVYGDNDYLSDLFDPETVIDPERPTDESLYAL